MVFIRNLALAASTLTSLVYAVPTPQSSVPAFVPGTLNNTQEFYISMKVTCGKPTYDNWYLQTYHTGAGLADPVFFPTTGSASRAYLNETHLQFDNSPYPFSAIGSPGDTNYARWEPITIAAGYGQGTWIINGTEGIVADSEEFDGWLVCEWFHGFNAPQLFQMIKGFDSGTGYGKLDFPKTCARVNLIPEYF